MRYLIITIAVLFMIPASAQQGFHVEGVHGIFKAPMIFNQNTYSGNELEYRLDLGYTIGVGGGYYFNDILGVFAEINYSLQGQKYEEVEGNVVQIEREVDLRYLEIPLLVKYTAPEGGVRFYAETGIYYGLLLEASIYHRILNIQNHTPDASERFQTNDFGYVFGTGANIYLSSNLYISTGVRMAYGLRDINSEGWRISPDNHPYRPSRNANIGLKVGLTYMFNEIAF